MLDKPKEDSHAAVTDFFAPAQFFELSDDENTWLNLQVEVATCRALLVRA